MFVGVEVTITRLVIVTSVVSLSNKTRLILHGYVFGNRQKYMGQSLLICFLCQKSLKVTYYAKNYFYKGCVAIV